MIGALKQHCVNGCDYGSRSYEIADDSSAYIEQRVLIDHTTGMGATTVVVAEHIRVRVQVGERFDLAIIELITDW